jgi:hypothetical protein
MSSQKHSEHHHLVRGWRAKRESFHFIEDMLDQEGACHKLKSPEDGYTIAVYFTELKNDPDRMVVRSTNWAAEYEPGGIFSKADCRAFWRRLVAGGFVAF